MESHFFALIDGPDLIVPFLLVAVGAGFQVTSGVGLGLIAGPGLLFLLDGPTAVQVAILLNLILTILLFPSERRLVDWASVKRISIWALLGIPVGIVVLLSLSAGWLKVASGAVVILAALQLLTAKSQFTKTLAHRIGMPGGGMGSGVMTGALGMPGPIALWAFLNTELPAHVIRANLRAYFLIAYVSAFVLHLVFNGWIDGVGHVTALLFPGILLGTGVGIYAKRKLTGESLRAMLEKLLIVMGSVLFVKGLWDVI